MDSGLRVAAGTIALKANGTAIAQQGAPEEDAGQGFIALLLAGLGIAPGIQPNEEEPASPAAPAIPRAAVRASVVRPVKEKLKDPADQVAIALPATSPTSTVVVPQLAPGISLDLRADDVPEKTMVDHAGAVTQGLDPNLLLNGSGPKGVGNDTQRGATELARDPIQASVDGAVKPRGETAFEVRIRMPDSETAPTPNSVPTSGAQSKATELAASPTITVAAVHAVPEKPDRGVSENAESLKTPQSPKVDAISAKTPARNEAGQDAEGEQDRKSFPDSRKEPEEPAPGSQTSPVRAEDTTLFSSGNSLAAPQNDSAPIPPAKLSSQATRMQAPETASTQRANPAPRDIALQLEDAGGSRVDVQLMDRGGTVHIVVRTQDDDLAKDLRTNLPELTQKLNQQQGPEAEAWNPGEMQSAAGGHDSSGHTNQQQQRGDSQSSAGGQDSGGRDGDGRQRPRPDSEDEFNQTFKGLFTGVTA